MQTKLNVLIGTGVLAVIILLLSSTQMYAQKLYPVPTTADTTIVNGVWDGSTSIPADEPGELTIQLGSVINGVPAGSLALVDTVTVDTGYAFSSLESLGVNDTTTTNYDTLWVQYWIQNFGNAVSDSFYVLASILDTTNSTGQFVPSDFDIVQSSDSTVVGGSPSADSAWYRFRLNSGAVETFYVRIVVPGPDSAADQDSIHIQLTIADSMGNGAGDSWPGVTSTRVLLDTSGSWYSHTINDTIYDFGDTQLDTIRLVIGGPAVRIRKITELPGGTLPGDSIIYTIYYDNDGSGETEDTAFIVDYLPAGVAFIGTLTSYPDTNTAPPLRGAGGARTFGYDVDYYYPPTGWIEEYPTATDNLSRDTLWAISAIRWTIPPGVAKNIDGDRPDSTVSMGVADDSLDNDAGMVKFLVRIR